jgi:lysozyme
MIKRHEGFRDRLYLDTEGLLTGGYGHLFAEGGKLSTLVCDILFDEDFKEARLTAEKLMDEYGVPNPTLTRKVVLIDMAFNLGYDRLRKFRKMWQSLKLKDYKTAADEMLDSKWAKQVGSRADELANLMREGKYPNA